MVKAECRDMRWAYFASDPFRLSSRDDGGLSPSHFLDSEIYSRPSSPEFPFDNSSSSDPNPRVMGNGDRVFV